MDVHPVVRPAIPVAVAIGMVAFSGSAFGDPAPIFLPEKGELPDLCQTDPKGEFAGGGKSFCGPVAVSNSLMAMFRRDLEWEDRSQYDLVNLLASPRFMNTHAVKGTGANALMQGVKTFLSRREVKDFSIKFQGWRPHWNEFRTGHDCPKLDWMRGTLAAGGAVWLNVGWYRAGEDEGEYRRISGHWVTAVGYGQDAEGKPNPAILVIHDPAPRSGLGTVRHHLVLEQLQSGKLTGLCRNLPRRARGLYVIRDGIHLKRGADHAIIDGAVALRLGSGEARTGDDA